MSGSLRHAALRGSFETTADLRSAADFASIAVRMRRKIWISAVATLILGIFPSDVLNFAGKSAGDMMK